SRNVNNVFEASSDSTFSREIPMTASTSEGTARDASTRRTQKCERRWRPEPTAIHSATRPNSRKPMIAMTPPEKQSTPATGNAIATAARRSRSGQRSVHVLHQRSLARTRGVPLQTLVVVRSPSHCAPHHAEQRKNQADHYQDDADRPQDRDLGQE